MIRLIRQNVERVAVSEDMATCLEAKGFTRIDGIKEPEVEEVKAGTAAKEPEASGDEESEMMKRLETMTINELRKLAKEKGLPGSTALSKAELQELLRDVV